MPDGRWPLPDDDDESAAVGFDGLHDHPDTEGALPRVPQYAAEPPRSRSRRWARLSLAQVICGVAAIVAVGTVAGVLLIRYIPSPASTVIPNMARHSHPGTRGAIGPVKTSPPVIVPALPTQVPVVNTGSPPQQAPRPSPARSGLATGPSRNLLSPPTQTHLITIGVGLGGGFAVIGICLIGGRRRRGETAEQPLLGHSQP